MFKVNMGNIKGVDKITARYNGWKPSDVGFIKSVDWSDGDVVIVAYCQLRKGINPWPGMSEDFFETVLLFEGVSKLKLEFAGNKMQQISGFDIIDVSSNGWEKINFQVEDYENGYISFYCGEVEIMSVSEPLRLFI